jgi:Na+/glutamate symporter
MKLDTLVLIVVCVIVGMSVTFWLAAMLLVALKIPFLLIGLLPAALVGFIVYRIIAERVGNAEEDHYDRMEH